MILNLLLRSISLETIFLLIMISRCNFFSEYVEFLSYFLILRLIRQKFSLQGRKVIQVETLYHIIFLDFCFFSFYYYGTGTGSGTVQCLRTVLFNDADAVEI